MAQEKRFERTADLECDGAAQTRTDGFLGHEPPRSRLKGPRTPADSLVLKTAPPIRDPSGPAIGKNTPDMRRRKPAGTHRHKGGTGFSKHGVLADRRIHAAAEFDVSNARRGNARSMRGARKTRQVALPRPRKRSHAAQRRRNGIGAHGRAAGLCVGLRRNRRFRLFPRGFLSPIRPA
ncbi:hypothetical protein [Nitratireductor arenosus]|uniref:hypothetical protein n=1 Tax=Nitratireductor arenosus TaxID=2682096 RepID=UPI0018D25330|nr:hypothetical protein [Nitratireductor arenosus]